MVFISFQAMACVEPEEKKMERFNLYDINKDGYVDAGEWNKIKPDNNFEKLLKIRDKNDDKKLSKEEFLNIDFVREC